MKITTNKCLWAMVAVLMVCLSACSNDDAPQPVNPPQENPEQWGDELPHVFYFDLDSIELPLNEDGYLCFKEQTSTPNEGYVPPTLDSIVMEKKWGYDKSTMKYDGLVEGPYAVSYVAVKGKRATPFNNVEVYKQMCRTIGVRPDSKFNNFPELADLPVRKVYSSYTSFQLDTLVSADIITHKYFNKDCPAGSSMRGCGNALHGKYQELPTYMALSGIPGGMFLDWWRGAADAQYPWMPEVTGLELGTYTGERRKFTSCIMPHMGVMIVGYPEKAGDYPMTIYLEFSSGKTLSKDFKIRFVEEK